MESQKLEDKRICKNCGSDKTYIKVRKSGLRYAKWVKGYCNKCYSKLVGNPKITSAMRAKHNSKWDPINNPKIFAYKGKLLYAKEKPRKGICSWCNKKIGDSFINCRGKISVVKKTHLHHLVYHDDDPLKDTVELCVSCHLGEHARRRYANR